MKILLVEDNEMNRDMLSRRLQRKGFDIVIAVNGEEAIDMTEKINPDLILMDMSLPIVDGWEATKTIKANMEYRHIPIIGLSAHAMSGDREKGLAAGCNEYETKPVDMVKLLKKISQLTSSEM